MKDLYLLLGSNLGNRRLHIEKAVGLIEARLGRATASSSYYETEPWGMSDQGLYLNKVLKLSSNQDPVRLLKALLSIESELGRLRSGLMNEARIIDIDILFYGEHVISTDVLEIPHPRIHLRKFALTPLYEIAPGLVHPVSGKTIGELLGGCCDNLGVSMVKDLVNQS